MSGLLLALTLSGCHDDQPATVEATVRSTSDVPYRAAGHDVIVIVLDTLRADHLSQYGYPLDTSPGLKALASHSTRFDNAYAPSPWTLPSSTSINTGQHPLRHGLRHPGDVLPESATTLAERMRGAGWHTGGFSHNVNVNPRHGFAQGFDAFTHNTGKVNAYPNVHRMVTAASTWLTEEGRGPSFVYLQPMNCHGPYKVPDSRETDLTGKRPSSGFRYYQGPMRDILSKHKLKARAKVNERYLRSLREQYDVAIRYETDEVGDFLDKLTASSRFNDALVILTADHGEELFDHGGFSHGYSLHHEVLRVPLFVKLPGQTEARTVTDDVSLLDIVPTVLEVSGVGAAPGDTFDGRSLATLASGAPDPGAAPRPLVFDVDWGKRVIGRGLTDGGWTLLQIDDNYEGLDHVTRLYNRSLDPLEQTDVSATEPAQVATMTAELARLVTGLKGDAPPQNAMTDEDRKQLEALGYLE